LSEVIPYLEQHGIYSRGRFGMWKYEVSNTDHTLMQGVELVNRLLLGEAEQTIGIKYESTLDGRNAANHERSVVAGSGDPKKAHTPAKVPSPVGTMVAQPGTVHAGTAEKATKTSPAAAGTTQKGLAAGGPGDKREVHISEEELGVTTQEDQ
jgi:hypothetical protein